MSKRKGRKSPKMEDPSSDFPQLDLINQPLAPVQPPALLPVPCPSKSPEPLMYKNRLQEFTQRSSIPLPVYQTYNEGFSHAPRFRSSVIVDGTCYVSGETFSHRKAAEQDVAKYALECIAKKIKDEGCPVIREDTTFCKSILNEFAVKMNLEKPTYNTIQSEGLLPLFASTLVFNGVTYNGEAGRNKKEAEQLAARAVILSLLDDPKYGTFLSEIIKAKAKLYVALNKVKDSSIFPLGTTPAVADTVIHNNKEVETAAVTNNVPTSAILQPAAEAEHPPHELMSIKSEQGPECVGLPISFVAPVVGQSSAVAEKFSGKRRRKKKKSKLDNDTQVAGAAVPLNQTAACSAL